MTAGRRHRTRVSNGKWTLKQRSRFASIAAAFMALQCLIAPVSGLIHMALVRHVWCAEHGELVHADESGLHGTHIKAEHLSLENLQSGRSRSLAVTSSADDESHEHDHCAVAASLRTPSAPVQRSHWSIALPLVRAEATLAPESRAPYRAFPVYLLAPKHSPPWLPVVFS